MHWLQKKIARLVCSFFLLEKCHGEHLTKVAAMMAAAGALFKTGSPLVALSSGLQRAEKLGDSEKSDAPGILRAF